MGKMRLTFEKGEATRYVGHLDILRTFIRALRRAEVPVKYSEGFNPHAIMTFALPLGVGVTSECELVDIAVSIELSPEIVIKNLNNSLQGGGIKILACECTDKPFGDIEKAEYYIKIKAEGKLDIDKIKKTLLQKEILVEKKSKKKTKEINIMEHIFETEIVCFDDSSFILRAVISAGNTFNIKPQLVASAIESATPGFAIKSIEPHRKRFIFIS